MMHAVHSGRKGSGGGKAKHPYAPKHTRPSATSTPTPCKPHNAQPACAGGGCPAECFGCASEGVAATNTKIPAMAKAPPRLAVSRRAKVEAEAPDSVNPPHAAPCAVLCKHRYTYHGGRDEANRKGCSRLLYRVYATHATLKLRGHCSHLDRCLENRHSRATHCL